jgi:hypothetical protein
MNKIDMLKAVVSMNSVKPVSGENELSIFLGRSFDIMFGVPTNETLFLKNTLIEVSNKDPDKVLSKIIEFMDLFNEFCEIEDADT